MENDSSISDTHSSEELPDLSQILGEYETLTTNQEKERKELLVRIDDIIRRSRQVESTDEKLDNFISLLLDIRAQVAGNPDAPETSPSPTISDRPQILVSQEEIASMSQTIQKQYDSLDDEISSLTHLLEKKKQEVDTKDLEIEELNDRLDMLTEEKSRLAHELEKLNSAIDSWKSQLDMLQQLASSDPRFRVIETLKKHGELSDIQLAFTMGTSINQLRKYLDDLLKLDLVKKTNGGKFTWLGQP